MKKWLFGGALVLLSGAVALEVATYSLRGWWAGEAFYRGRPTTFWSRELAQMRPIFC